MGLFLRYNLFYGVSPQAVYDVYAGFYRERGMSLAPEGKSLGEAYELYQRDGDWTVLRWNKGWEWVVRREAQLHVSRKLRCPGFLVFVYDGDYWAYEFFEDGVVLDCFVQSPDESERWFPVESCRGDTAIVTKHLPFLDRDILERYLVQTPSWDEFDNAENPRQAWLEAYQARDVKVQPSDEFTVFAECAVLDFLRYLGVRVELRDRYVTLQAPVWTRFWIERS